MIILLSPSKTQVTDIALPDDIATSQPELLQESFILARELKKYSASDIAKLMKISDKLGQLNYERYKHWSTPFTPENATAAAFTFKGDVYDGLDFPSLSKTSIKFAQQHLRIISGLYGILRPLDIIQPYRLEMKTRLKILQDNDLYGFWGERITDAINNVCKEAKTNTVINLASNEYFRAIKPDTLHAKIVTPIFKDQKNGEYKVIGLFAKRARGKMARHIISNHITSPDRLASYTNEGYSLAADMSDSHTLTFTRKQSTKAA